LIELGLRFRSKEAEKVWNRQRSAKLPFNIQSKSRDKLAQIDAAIRVEDLRFPPGNRLEVMGGDRAGQFSIRINQQWRICFRWEAGNAFDLEIIDYH
jgi:proteic killer suppression protein